MIDFFKGKLKKIDKAILKSFVNLPYDKYEKSKGYYFRFRRFSKFYIINDSISFISDTKFFQAKQLNRYAGGLKRKFLPIEDKIKFKMVELFKNNFLGTLNNKKKMEIGLHQLRIKCGKNFVGYPVPEGWHKDGFNFVILINFGSKNITGGVTRIKEKLNDNKDTFSSFLEKGEFIFTNDKKLFHYTDPINVKKQNVEGSRDTLVITIKQF